MRSTTEAPAVPEPPPPDYPNQGIDSHLGWRREEPSKLFPTVLLNPGDTLFLKIVRREEEYPFKDLVIVIKQQRVDALLDDNGQKRVETTEDGDIFTGVMYDSRPMWKRTLSSPQIDRG